MKKEKSFYFRDYAPIFIGIIILGVLGYALYFVVNYTNPIDPIKVPEKVMSAKYKEKKVDVSASTCPKINMPKYVEMADEIGSTYKYYDVLDEEKTSTDSSFDEPEDYGVSKIPFIFFGGLKEGLYLTIESPQDPNKPEKFTVDDYDDDGTMYYECPYTEKVMTYTIKVFVDVEGCRDVMVRKFTIQIPVYNPWSNQIRCTNYPNFKYCAEYLMEDVPSYTTYEYAYSRYLKDIKEGRITTVTTKSLVMNVVDKNLVKEDQKEEVKKIQQEIEKQREEAKKEKEKKNSNKKKKYYYYGGAGAIIILIGIVVIILIRRKRRALR